MKRLLISVLIISLCLPLVIGGAFAVFSYEIVDPTSEQAKDIRLIGFDYCFDNYVYTEGFTDSMKKMMYFADGTNIRGFDFNSYYPSLWNTGENTTIEGVAHAYMSTSYNRNINKSYGYVGSMDPEVGKYFYADSSISVVMSYVITITEGSEPNITYRYVINLYITDKEILQSKNIDEIIDVFKVTYEYNDGSYYLVRDVNNKPTVTKGSSVVKSYEYTNGSGAAKTFGMHNGTEIFVTNPTSGTSE